MSRHSATLTGAVLLSVLSATAAIVAAPDVRQASQAPARAPAADVRQPDQPSQRRLSLEEQEQFLATARILETHQVSTGVTGTRRATLTNGAITHDASIQTIDESRREYRFASGTEFNFRDTWTYNVAALVRCDRRLLERVRALDAATVAQATSPYLGPREVKALLARRDLLVAHFDAAGPGALFDLPPR